MQNPPRPTYHFPHVLDAQPHEAGEFPPLPAGRQPSPYSTALPKISADDPTTAFDELEAWIAKSPGARSVWTMDRLNGKWRVGLMADAERFSASQDQTLRDAIRNALMIAKFAGCL